MNIITMDQEAQGRKSTRQYQENTCNVCHNQFSMTNRHILCSTCFQKTCRHHITTEKSHSTCDICLRIELKKKIMQDHHEHINSLKNDLRSLQHREKANLKEITVKTQTITKLEGSLKSQHEEFNTKLKTLDSSILSETKHIEESTSKISSLTAMINSSKSHQKKKQEFFANITTELIKVQKDHSIIKEEHTLLSNKANKLIKENEKLITFQKVRTLTCNRCYKEVILKFKDEIIKILGQKENKNDLIASILAVRMEQTENLTNQSCKCLLF
ncbi:hypothetical protein SteCoe_35262 [Stentor coeruleus]|uniref:FYVE-type domain-containing protein n=1 Tax=Stentor coeruleus TaxID=5963 RepID=A0A1R2ASW0_9CILI|nr:hypothetical protein SteCoe_35262 [Stentor coeruleus]